MLSDKESSFFKKLIGDYYFSIGNLAPRNMERREFGFGDFERKISYRHYAFRDERLLKNYLSSQAPAFVSCSFSEYQIPDGRPMESKKWLGGELLFDIDASDLNLKCRKEHASSWVCEKCLDGAKAETVKLVEEFLIPDFGFLDSEISINFSGNRGYHIHVNNEGVFRLDGDARKQISNYITGNNIDLTSFFPTVGKDLKVKRGIGLRGPRPTDYGWGGKLANGAIKAVNGGVSGLMELGIEKKEAQMLTRKSAEITLGISTGNWDKVNIPNKAEFWSNVLKGIAVNQSDAIDKNVSTDIYHLIRLPGTIHGDTGLVAKGVKSLKLLGSFEPMDHAVAFGDKPIRIKTLKTPKFAMHNTEFGPFDANEVELPTYAAAYLVLKRFATLS